MLTRRLVCASGLALASAGAVAQAPGLRLSAPRACHTTVGMPDGSVLFMAGCVGNGCEIGPASSTVDRYDPATRSIKPAGRLTGPRLQGASAVLPDQTVLLAGGWISGAATASVELFNPVTGQSRAVGEITKAQPVTAVTLQGGRVALIGENGIDLFDPSTDRISALTKRSEYREGGSATLLLNGKVLVAGGGVTRAGPRAEAFLLDPANGQFAATAGLSAERCKHAAVRLADGRVLVIGGSDRRGRNGGKYRNIEVYDPGASRFTSVGQTQEARFKIPDAAVLLQNGKVLVAGGADYPELIDPRTWKVRRVDFALDAMLNFSTAVALPNGDVLVAGGYLERTINPTDAVWIIPKAALT